MREADGGGWTGEGMAADGISDGNRNKMENQHEQREQHLYATRFKELISKRITPIKQCEQQRIQAVVYLAYALDDLGEFVLNFEEEVEEFLRQLRDKTYTNRDRDCHMTRCPS